MFISIDFQFSNCNYFFRISMGNFTLFQKIFQFFILVMIHIVFNFIIKTQFNSHSPEKSVTFFEKLHIVAINAYH